MGAPVRRPRYVTGGNKADPSAEAKDIGVITPYHAQAKKIRQLLSGEDTKNTQVASVELFQGQVFHFRCIQCLLFSIFVILGTNRHHHVDRKKHPGPNLTRPEAHPRFRR
jgi:hypothetical protein